MTIEIDLRPEVQAELSRQAAAQGLEIGAYAASLLEDAAHLVSKSASPTRRSIEGFLKKMAQFSESIPSLPDEFISREGLYLARDSIRIMTNDNGGQLPAG